MERLTSKETRKQMDEYLKPYNYNAKVEMEQNQFLDIYDRLLQFEDFMEENGFENLEELKELLSANYKLTNAVSDLDKDFICKCLLEYPEIKNRWNKLKQYINNQQPLIGNNISFPKETLLQKIQELENLKLGD